jgi:hypothetical protein
MFSKSIFTVLILLVLAGIGSTSGVQAQSLSGTTGLATIPTARMQQDGTMSFGVSYFDKKDQQYFEGTKNFGTAYVNFTFLPFVEIVLRVNRPLFYHSTYTVDRFPMVRLRVLNETKFLPAVVVGLHDFASTSAWSTVHFNATYLVMSKKMSDFDFHLGYAPIIMKALYYQLDGVFGGVAYSPVKQVNLFAEYDTRYINAGFQVLFLKHFSASVAAINFNSFSAGINYKVFLK